MAAEAGVERDATGLARLIDTIDTLEAAHGEADALTAARFVAAGAIERKESRGGHFRTDHPAIAAAAIHTRLTLAEARAVHPFSSPIAEPAE